MVSYKKKIEECYTKCSMCGRIFNNEKYDMASYGYCDKKEGKKIYFCSYSCFMKHKRSKGRYAGTQEQEQCVNSIDAEPDKKTLQLGCIHPVGCSLNNHFVTESVTAIRQKGVHYEEH